LCPIPQLGLGKIIVNQQHIGSIGRPIPASSFVSSQAIIYTSSSSLSNKYQNEFHRKHIVIPYTLCDNNIQIDTHVLLHYGCTGISLINEDFSNQYNFPCYKLHIPETIQVIHSHPISSSHIIEYVHINYTISDYHESFIAYIIPKGHYRLVYGIP
jgi:hypothetical protein